MLERQRLAGWGAGVLDRLAGWGTGVLDRLAGDLRAAFPEQRGFSRRNLHYMRALAAAWPLDDIGEFA